MGSDTNQKTEETKTISEVVLHFNQIKDDLEKRNTKNHSVIIETLSLMASAIETINSFHKGERSLVVNSIEYTQTIRSLSHYSIAASSYLDKQENKDRDKLYEISGHIVDRVSQKALEWGGKTALKKHYELQKENINKLSSIIGLLKTSATTLNQYVNDQATDSLQMSNSSHPSFKNKIYIKNLKNLIMI